MRPPTRRHRHSDKPLDRPHVIEPKFLHERYVQALRWLEPYHYCKYATAPWLHFLADPKIEYSVFRKYIGYMREEPNGFIGCPEQQLASPNTSYKHLVYELRERGLNELIRRGLATKRVRLEPDTRPKKRRRNRAFAYHRANSYYHEIIIDLGYYLPLRYLVTADPALRLIDLSQVLERPKVPAATRQSRDPLLITLRDAEMRFDGTPHIIARRAHDGEEYSLFLPGIQVDRGTETFAKVETHILHALEFVESRHYERHWGFTNCIINQAARRSAAAGTMLLYMLCLTYSVTSAVGLAAQNREGVSASRQVTRDAYEDTRRELLDLESRRANAKAKDRTRLDTRIDEVRTRLRTLQNGTPVPVDAQAVFLSGLTFGLVAPQNIRLGLAALFALMVEVGTTIGLFIALSHPSQQPAPTFGRWRPRVD
jgi:hypothetical protein